MAHLSAAMQLSRHPGFSETASRISFFLLKSQTEAMLVYPDSLEPEGPANGDAKVLSGDYFPQDEIQELEDVVAAYRASPADKAAVGQVRALRDGLCSYLLDSEKTELEKLFSGNFAKMFSLLRESGFVSDGEESREHQLEKRANDLIAASSEDLRGLLAMMLLCPAHWANLPVELAGKPEWFSGFYLDYLMTSPEGFVYRGEAEMYMDHLSTVLAAVERAVASVPVPPAVAQAAFHFALRLNLIPAYFAQRDMKACVHAHGSSRSVWSKRDINLMPHSLPHRFRGKKSARVF